jgi:hypothetical protein
MAANVLLNQLLYWHGKGDDPDGWIYKSRAEILHETGLRRDTQETARRELRLRGFLQEKFSDMPRRLLFRLNLDAINAAWEEAIYQHKVEIQPTEERQCLSHKVETPPSIRRESRQQEGGNPASKKAGIPPAYTESTTESTTENKTPNTRPGENFSGVQSFQGEGQVTPPVDESRNDPTTRPDEAPIPAPLVKGPQRYEDTPGFCALWAIAVVRPSGSKGKKAQAWARWKKVRPSPEEDQAFLERILTAYAYQKTTPEWRRKGGQFVSELQVWIGEQAWEGVEIPQGFDRHAHTITSPPALPVYRDGDVLPDGTIYGGPY